MFAVVIDSEHGVVAAPADMDALTPEATGALFAIDYGWNDRIEAFTTTIGPNEQAEDVALWTCVLLMAVGCTVVTGSR